MLLLHTTKFHTPSYPPTGPHPLANRTSCEYYVSTCVYIKTRRASYSCANRNYRQPNKQRNINEVDAPLSRAKRAKKQTTQQHSNKKTKRSTNKRRERTRPRRDKMHGMQSFKDINSSREREKKIQDKLFYFDFRSPLVVKSRCGEYNAIAMIRPTTSHVSARDMQGRSDGGLG